jgi:type IV fimbrial biogenesis protein FimT
MTAMATSQSTSIAKPSGYSRHHGFTILELMMTLTIAAVLLGIAIPSFRGMMISSRLRTATNDFAGAINTARSEAITRNTPVTFCRVATNTDTECAGSPDAWTNWVIRNPVEVIRRGEISTAGSVSVSSTLTDDRIVFSPDGLTRDATGVVTGGGIISVCSSGGIDDNLRELTLGSASRVTIEKSTGDCP